MYIPKLYKVTDPVAIAYFIRNHPFGTLVAAGENAPIAAHLPFQFSEDNRLTCHVAYANPIWKVLSKRDSALAIFTGPHAYVSSSWYNHLNVPTWNYTAVHVTGRAELMKEEELRRDLQNLLDHYEAGREGAVLWPVLPEEYVSVELKKIVGIKILVDKIEASYKLSQNRDQEDFDSICRHLEGSERSEERQTAALMQEMRVCPFKQK